MTAIELGFDPSQPREPAGGPGGGQWTAAGAGLTTSSPALRPATAVYTDEYGQLDVRSTGVDRIRQVVYEHDGGSDVFDVVLVEEDGEVVGVDVENLYGVDGTIEGEAALEAWLNEIGVDDITWDGDRGTEHATARAAEAAGDATDRQRLVNRVEDVYSGTFTAASGIEYEIGDVNVVSREGMTPVSTEVSGSIYVDGDEIGTFRRAVYADGTVYNHSLSIDADHQGFGIGTAFLDKTEADLGPATYKLSAVNVGKYAWAARGYRLDPAPGSSLWATTRDAWIFEARKALSDTPEWRAGDFSKLDSLAAVEAAWKRDRNSIYPSDLLAIDPSLKSVLINGPSWDAVRTVGAPGGNVQSLRVLRIESFAYDPAQPRVPAGGRGGGRWTAKNDAGRDIAQEAKLAPTARGGSPDEWFADQASWAKARALADEKARNVPKPTVDQIAKNRAALEKARTRGRPGGEMRGNSYTRRDRARALFAEFGGDEGGWCPCTHCGIKLAPKGEGGYARLQQDKILTLAEGGTYGTPRSFPNLIPACGGCNNSRGDTPYPVRPDWWEETSLAASAGRTFLQAFGVYEVLVADLATGRPVGWDDPTLDVDDGFVEGPYYARQANTWFGTYDQHLVGGETCEWSTITVLDTRRTTDELAYDPNQPRHPAGGPQGGQWAPDGGAAPVGSWDDLLPTLPPSSYLYTGAQAVAAAMSDEDRAALRKELTDPYFSVSDMRANATLQRTFYEPLYEIGEFNLDHMRELPIGIAMQLAYASDRLAGDDIDLTAVSAAESVYFDSDRTAVDMAAFSGALTDAGSSPEYAAARWVGRAWANGSTTPAVLGLQAAANGGHLRGEFEYASAYQADGEWIHARFPNTYKALASAYRASTRAVMPEGHQFKVWRGTGQSISDGPVGQNPLSSWTFDTSEARAFAMNRRGVVLGATVTADDVFAIAALTGFGSFGESEVVLNDNTVNVTVVSYHDGSSE